MIANSRHGRWSSTEQWPSGKSRFDRPLTNVTWLVRNSDALPSSTCSLTRTSTSFDSIALLYKMPAQRTNKILTPSNTLRATTKMISVNSKFFPDVQASEVATVLDSNETTTSPAPYEPRVSEKSVIYFPETEKERQTFRTVNGKV